MSNLRERRKQETEQKILHAAQETFLSLGYQKTTVARIAREAGIAVGTFYNYFSSKSQLFLYIFFDSPQGIQSKAQYILNHPGEDVIEAVISLCKVYLDAAQNTGKELWKEIIKVFFADIEEHKNTMSEFIALDFQLIDQLKLLLSYYREQNLLNDSLDPADAAESIYSIFCFQMIKCLFLEAGQSLETMVNNTYRQIRLFFAGKF